MDRRGSRGAPHCPPPGPHTSPIRWVAAKEPVGNRRLGVGVDKVRLSDLAVPLFAHPSMREGEPRFAPNPRCDEDSQFVGLGETAVRFAVNMGELFHQKSSAPAVPCRFANLSIESAGSRAQFARVAQDATHQRDPCRCLDQNELLRRLHVRNRIRARKLSPSSLVRQRNPITEWGNGRQSERRFSGLP